MILNYYQSVELMSFLPVLLSNVDAETIVTIADTAEEANSGVYQMWNISTTGMEVNGADFY